MSLEQADRRGPQRVQASGALIADADGRRWVPRWEDLDVTVKLERWTRPNQRRRAPKLGACNKGCFSYHGCEIGREGLYHISGAGPDDWQGPFFVGTGQAKRRGLWSLSGRDKYTKREAGVGRGLRRATVQVWAAAAVQQCSSGDGRQRGHLLGTSTVVVRGADQVMAMFVCHRA